MEPRLLSRLYAGMAAGGAAFLLLRRLAVSLPDGLHQVQALLRGVPHNVTTEMDLALWATACTLKADPTSVQRFTQADAATLAAEALAGQLPDTAQQAIAAFLQRYGMRGLVEIDLARPRWREAPEMLMQVVQRYLDIQNPAHAPDVLFAQGAATAEAALDRLVHALARTRGGWVKAWLARRAGRRLRLLAGLREHPKFFRVCWLDIMRQRLREVGRELVAGGLFTQPDDVFFLQLSELQALAAGHTRDWHTLITQRRQAYAREQTRRQIPAVLLSDGQAVFPGHRREGSCGGGLLGGTPVSPGVSEGTVRVMREPSEGTLQPGEILVCHATDPSWTPLFLLARGIVMEVGGVMTHGSVVAREYGIPALVGVDQATTRLQTGQHIRIDGASGNITILSAPPGQNAPVV